MRKLYSCWFGGARFARMARVIERSAAKHLPHWTIEVERCEPPATMRLDSFGSNTFKLGQWVKQVRALPDGAELLLIDSDCLIARPVDDAFDLPFEVAVTRKAEHVRQFPHNCGVVFVRGGAIARAFFERWQEVNDRFYRDKDEHRPYERKYGGINQAAFGYMRERGELTGVIDLPAQKYNACYDPLWSTAMAEASIIHYKSQLRNAAFTSPRPGPYLPLINLWRSYALGDTTNA